MKIALWTILALVVALVAYAWFSANTPEGREQTRALLAIEECRKQPDLLGACATLEDKFRQKYGRSP